MSSTVYDVYDSSMAIYGGATVRIANDILMAYIQVLLHMVYMILLSPYTYVLLYYCIWYHHSYTPMFYCRTWYGRSYMPSFICTPHCLSADYYIPKQNLYKHMENCYIFMHNQCFKTSIWHFPYISIYTLSSKHSRNVLD